DHVAGEGWHACDYLLACDMEMDAVPGYRFASWETGYGDMHCVPDFATLRRAAWLPNTALVLCDLFTIDSHEPIRVAPRQMLRDQIAQAAEMGFSVRCGSEYELYLFDETFETAASKHYHDLKPIGGYNEDYHILQGTREEGIMAALRRALDQSGVPVEFSKGEAGLGQQELNLRYCDALAQADRNVLYKHAAKEIAHAQGKAVTFMAKWDERHTGSSAHLHLSLWNADGTQPAFPGEQQFGPLQASDAFRWFLGGWITHARELSVCFAPYPASYKRYQSRSWAPTALAWSYDNRTAGFRVVGRGKSLRIECRIPGADANPYVAYAAALAAGIDGIRNRIEPPPIFQGDIYAARELPRVPATLYEAIGEFERSAFARQALGGHVFEHYLHFVRTEQAAFDAVVTSWERARYFERA
ncbi:MAG TPA: glutamine synthetase family protein, partial [Roseiflexaceae bacterium]|nr:glutamine synthetase family protein [Roseiflexaceae bacterium]